MSKHSDKAGQVLMHVAWARDPEGITETQQFGHDYVIAQLGAERGPVTWQITDGSKREATTMVSRLGEGERSQEWADMLSEIQDLIDEGPDDDGGHVVVTMCEYRPHRHNRAHRRANRKKKR